MSDITRTYATPIPASVETLEQWHRSPGALNRLLPPWMKVNVVERSGTVDPGDWVRVHASVAGPVGFDWTLVHESLSHSSEPGFVDEQLSGPFAAWRHEHRYIPNGSNSSVLEDRLIYRLPAGSLGKSVADGKVTHILDHMFALRHLRTWNDLIRHREAGFHRPLRIAITGSSGLVGQRLIPFLEGGGHEIVRLVRHAPTSANEVQWDPKAGTIDSAGLEGIDAVVHLAGVSIAGGRWTASRKEAILRSRVDGTRLLATTLAGMETPPSVLVSTSAIGFYGDTGDRECTEDTPAGTGFLADVCQEWESAADPAREAGIRVVHPRFGVVFAGDGGMLPLIAKPFSAGIGGKIGSGKQVMSWVSLEDLTGILLACIADERLDGPVNAVSPEPVTNQTFTTTMGDVFHRPTLFPVPAAAIKTVAGELGEELILASQRVVPRRLEAIGFRFAFPSLQDTLRVELGKSGLVPGANQLPAPNKYAEEISI